MQRWVALVGLFGFAAAPALVETGAVRRARDILCAMAVSDRDKQYFARIGLLKDESHATAARAHQLLSLDERLSASWALYLAHRAMADLTRRDDDPSPFYDRARKLGLYRD